MSRPYDLEFRLERAKEIERALHKKGWSKSLLAEKAGYDEKTVRNLFDGKHVKHQTLFDVCKTLDIEPKIDNDIENIDCSDDEFGGYLRKTHEYYEGFYHIYRRSFTQIGKIYRSVLKVEWDKTEERFSFSEFYIDSNEDKRILNQHSGAVYMSPYTNLVQLLTVYQGSIRLITATRMRQSDGIMRGIICTQCEDINYFQPAISPVVLHKIKNYDPDNQIISDIGLISEDDRDFRFAHNQIKITETKVVRICSDQNNSTYNI